MKPLKVATTELPSDVETAYAAVTGDGWVARKAELLKDDSRLVSREDTPDGGVTVVVSRALPAGVPGALTKFLPKDGRVTQTDRWGPPQPDGSRVGRWDVDSPGVPAELGGQIRLEPTATGCRQVVEGAVTVKIPLIGGKVESYLADMTHKLATREGEVVRDLLAGA